MPDQAFVPLPAIADHYEDDVLQLRYMPGRSARLVIAITGVGHNMGAEQTEEFVASASANGENHVLFVIDRKRSWFTQPGVIERTCAETQTLMAKIGCEAVSTLGNSMGGYGAILLGKYLPVSACVAFAPQYSMNRLIVFERRWRKHRPNIRRAPVWGLNAALSERTRYLIVYGDDPQDLKHQRKFRTADNLTMAVLPGGGHSPAARLKELGQLQAVLTCGLAGDSDTFWQIMDMCSIPDDHISPRRSALFMARSVLRDFRDGGRQR